MGQYLLMHKHQSRRFFCNPSHPIIQILLISIVLHYSSNLRAELNLSSTSSQQSHSSNGRNLNLGPLGQPLDSTHLVTDISSQETESVRGDRLSNITTLKNVNRYQQQEQQQRRIANNGGREQNNKQPINDSGKEDTFPANCFAKRNEVLKRQSQTSPVGPSARVSSSTQAPNLSVGFQRLRPKVDALGVGSAPIVLNVTLANSFDGEHMPRCRPDGSYDPVQCHKIGYCWCVNRYGQAIKNSAVRSGEEPECDPSMYESESNNQLVVAGISQQRVKNILKAGSAFDSSTPNGHINFEATEPTTSQDSSETTLDGHQQVETQNRLTSREPVMPLIPNDCKNSRENARNRAATQINDSIWVPECDKNEEKLYAERQCHKTTICWCVDQTTGLPLRTSEQLSSRTRTHNCTEIKKILGISNRPTSLTKPGHHQETGLAATAAFYQGSSEYCDADKRADFVISLNNQFRQQISEYLRQNPTSSLPTELSSSNPYQISELQVAKWKFAIMDRDLDGKIGDREWSKFKNNFKLVDKVAELDNPFKQQKSPYFSLTPLLIVRSQRKCWRDFLEFCGNGELVDESISLTMWLSCTEVPPKLTREDQTPKSAVSPSSGNTYALSREAAIVRSQKKNPFLGILKPD